MKSYVIISDETQDAGERVSEIFEYDGTNGSASKILLDWCLNCLDSGNFEPDFKFPTDYQGLVDLLWDHFEFSVQLF